MKNMKQTRYKKVSIAILTGGHSSRMGRNKAELMMVNDPLKKSFLSHLCDVFACFENKYISINSGQSYSIEGYDSVVDTVSDIGPLGGIYSVLSNCKTDAVFFIACDMPFFSLEAVEYFINKWDGELLAISKVEGIREPLAGIYTKECLQEIERQIATGNYKLGLLINNMNGQYIDMTAYKKSFTNVNTIDDYERFICC